MKNILFFGDSLTAGYGLADAGNESYPALIGQKISAEGLSYRIINAGVSGDTSGGGLNRLDYWISQPVDVFVLELGINDLTRRTAPSTIYNNLEAIVKKVIAKHPKVKLALMGMQLPAFIPGTLVAEFRAIYQKLADTYHMALVPFFLDGVAGMRHLNIRDGIHPNAEGYGIIANNVWPVLRTLL
ncbi:arylesterase [Mucilaginibacter myungsuensis]|uniref:Arylesterase n=1 Tax=Mucilaginibacter myungsuensis TaxID=649104 RepID=A0A929PXR7_9SPHI|nr:arylesterase [Mucilaginibacter myungsuensis]MBE9662690.1 arylesterase [Mucilaginibacter myungsuensis]MDN3598110.1 arylesterase [Mucilaginibacter myungsuensis]